MYKLKLIPVIGGIKSQASQMVKSTTIVLDAQYGRNRAMEIVSNSGAISAEAIRVAQ